jgi:hypothetical protein
MAEQFLGQCIGGPMDGKMMAYWSKTKVLLMPKPTRIGYLCQENIPFETMEVGEYLLNDFNQWHWWQSEEGKAYEALFGPI